MFVGICITDRWDAESCYWVLGQHREETMYLTYRNSVVNMKNVIRLHADYENLIADCVDGKSRIVARYDNEQNMDNAIEIICIGIQNGAKYVILPDEKEE